jgi:hypothetical protein
MRMRWVEICRTHRVEDKCVHDFGEGKLEDLRVDSSSPPPYSSVFSSDTTTPARVLVFCTRSFQAFLSLTIWIQFLSFSSVVYGRGYY